MILPNFDDWSHDSLVSFAKDCYAQMLDDMTEIMALNKDLKDAIKAYRYINTKEQHEKETNT